MISNTSYSLHILPIVFTSYVLRFTAYTLQLTSYIFHFTHYVLRLTSYALRLSFIAFIIFFSTPTKAQEIPYPITNLSVYDYLDEMANNQIIEVNSAARPWSRKFISGKLQEIDSQREVLNKRQTKDLDFFLKDFNKEIKPDKHFEKRFDIFYYKDSLFTFSLNPILGIQYFANENGSAIHWWNGLEVFTTMGKHLGIYASLRDNHDAEFLSNPDYINRRFGANYKGNGDYSELRGGITWSWNWGSFGLVKDYFTWGNNYNGANIFSEKAPSFGQIYLNLKPVKWFEFKYVHGWLISEVVDSTRSYFYTNGSGTHYREVYHPKYIAANLFTFTPFKKFNASFGNSIVYADLGVFPTYLIPFAFFKSIDHTVNHGNDNQNSQMFFDFSSRQIKHLHLYTTIFFDELSTSRMFDKDQHSNFYSWKIGGRLSDFPIRNISLTIEYTRTNPLTYQHPVPTLEFTSNKYNLGYYAQDNNQEIYIALEAKPIRGLWLQASYFYIQKGPDYSHLDGSDRWGLPFMESIEWENSTFKLNARYEIINDAYVFAGYQFSNISGNDLNKYTHPLWRGKTNTFSAGVNFGF